MLLCKANKLKNGALLRCPKLQPCASLKCVCRRVSEEKRTCLHWLHR